MQLSSAFLDLLDVDRKANVTCNCFANLILFYLQTRQINLKEKKPSLVHHYCTI